MMIYTVHYEPQSARQRFEPREPQEQDLEQSPLVFSLHLRLRLYARRRRTSHSIVARVTTIFAAFMGALSLTLGPFWTHAQGTNTPAALETLFGLAGLFVLAGALPGLGAVLLGGIPLLVSAWRTSPRSRVLFLVPILAGALVIACALLIVFLMTRGVQRPPLIFPVILFYGGTFVSTIAIIRAIHQARIADRWLGLANHLSRVVAGGMILMFAGVMLWGFALALVVSGWFTVLVPWLLFASGMFLAVIVALWASFWRVQPPASQPRPRDASPSEVDSCGEPRGYRG